jgi:hypothetical protein
MPPTSTAPLTPAMIEAIKDAIPGQVVGRGATRAALIRRGLVHNMESPLAGQLTAGGLQLRAKMHPAEPAEPEAESKVNFSEPAATPKVNFLATDRSPLATWVARLFGVPVWAVLDERVRQAHLIPEGRRRHGQVKAARDALRHARKLELANL